MTLLAAPLRHRTALLASVLVLASASLLDAQVALSHTDDAAPVPRGVVRLRLTNAWTRFDQRYGPDGLLASGDELSADPLGVDQFPLLAPIESSLRSLSANPRTRLSLGRLITSADTRIVTTPIALEYGLTRRLSVGVIVPVVQTRRTVGVSVNAASGAPANVGLVPLAERAAAARANDSARVSAAAAAAALSSLISRCQATPGALECARVTADPAGAAAAVARAGQLAAGAGTLGITAGSAVVAPRATGLVALEIELQRNALNRQLQDYLGAGAAQASRVYFAPTDFSYIDFQGRDGTPGLLQGPIAGGLDSIRTTERIGVGDITIGAQYLVFDRFRRDGLAPGRLQTRLAVGGSFRLATSRPDTVTNLVDVGTGDGGGLELRSALDLISGRFGGTVAARYAHSFARNVSAPLFGDPERGFPLPLFGSRSRRAGDVVGLDLTPRYLLSQQFALDAHYGIERTGPAQYAIVTPDAVPDFCGIVDCSAPSAVSRTAQRLGLGMRYSTVEAHLRGEARVPFEVRYLHLTTVSGDPGVPKLSREQIQLRLFYRLLGR